MFNKDNKLERLKDAETIIGASIKVKGNFHGQGDIIIEGFLEGSLKTNSNIYIGDKAKVVANVESKDLIVNGEIRGNVKTKNYLSLGSTARIYGDIQYSEISVSRGATINGQLILITDEKKSENKKSDISETENVENIK